MERERERSRRERHLWPFYAWPVNYNKTVLEPIKLLDLNAVECRSKWTFVQWLSTLQYTNFEINIPSESKPGIDLYWISFPSFPDAFNSYPQTLATATPLPQIKTSTCTAFFLMQRWTRTTSAFVFVLKYHLYSSHHIYVYGRWNTMILPQWNKDMKSILHKYLELWYGALELS